MEKRARRRTIGRKLSAAPAWTAKEEKLLYEAVKESGNKRWKSIINAIKKRHHSFDRTPEQCFRRYKEYLNPSCHTNEWQPGQGVMLMLFHNVHGNKWNTIARIIREPSPALLAEYFYEYIHKMVRFLKERYVPLSILDMPANFLEACYVVDMIQRKYVPALTLFAPSEDDPRENGILGWLRQKDISAPQVESYRDLIFSQFREHNKRDDLPITVSIDLGRAHIVGQDAEELMATEKTLNTRPHHELLQVKFVQGASPVLVPDTISGTNKPMSVAAPSAAQTGAGTKRRLTFSFPVYRSMLPVFVPRRPPQPVETLYVPVPMAYQQQQTKPGKQKGGEQTSGMEPERKKRAEGNPAEEEKRN